MKKEKMVFNLSHEDQDEWREHPVDIDFVFYPKESHMHGFHDEPPKTFKEVYKVYYSWAIEKTEGSHPVVWQVQFSIGCDECSALTCLSEVIRQCIREKKDKRCLTAGQEGSDWHLFFIKRGFYPVARVGFYVFSNFTNKGYRFYLEAERAEQFADFLDEVNNHMLENGEPI